MAKKKKAVVFAVPSDESASGFHEVIFAKDGDLNKAARRGDIRNFRKWDKAVEFAKQIGRDLNAEVILHGYRGSKGRVIDYSKTASPKKQKALATKARLSRKAPRITPKVGRLR